MRKAHAFEEEVVYPVFGKNTALAKRGKIPQAEHIEDETDGAALFIGHGGTIGNPEAFGFMLRSFFEAVRRYVAFE